MTEPRRHKVARCRWCQGQFVQVFGSQWLCETQTCAERQISHAVAHKEAPEGASPYLYLPTPAQCELHESKCPNVLFGGAAAGSKSHGLRWNAYKNCLTIPDYSVLLLRRTYPELESTHLISMARDAAMLNATYDAQKRRMHFKDTGAMISAGHCDTPKDMHRYLSTEYDEIIKDEATTFEADVIREVSSRARSSKQAVADRGGAFVRLGSNPGGVGALYISDIYILKSPDPDEAPNYDPSHYEFIRARVSDNPYAPEDYTSLRLDTLSVSRQKQLRDGDWSVFGSQFFQAWAPELDGAPWHVRRIEL